MTLSWTLEADTADGCALLGLWKGIYIDLMQLNYLINTSYLVTTIKYTIK